MAEFSGRPQYDDPQSEEDEAVADSGTKLAYRRLAASSGEQQRSYNYYYLDSLLLEFPALYLHKTKWLLGDVCSTGSSCDFSALFMLCLAR